MTHFSWIDIIQDASNFTKKNQLLVITYTILIMLASSTNILTLLHAMLPTIHSSNLPVWQTIVSCVLKSIVTIISASVIIKMAYENAKDRPTSLQDALSAIAIHKKTLFLLTLFDCMANLYAQYTVFLTSNAMLTTSPKIQSDWRIFLYSSALTIVVMRGYLLWTIPFIIIGNDETVSTAITNVRAIIRKINFVFFIKLIMGYSVLSSLITTLGVIAGSAASPFWNSLINTYATSLTMIIMTAAIGIMYAHKDNLE